MDKKLLVSVMMATPVAAFAQQAEEAVSNWTPDNGYLVYGINVNASGYDWTADGGMETVSSNGTVITCIPGTGSVSHQLQLLPGNYTLKVDGLDNAEVYLNDEKLEVIDGEVAIPADKISPILNVIKVKHINAALDFTVGSMTLTLDFNFITAKQALDTKLKGITLSEIDDTVDPVNPSDEAKALRTQYGTLDAEIKAIQAEINGIDTDDAASMESAYKTYEFEKYSSEDKIDLEIDALDTTASTYNDAVTAENARYAKYLDDKAAYEALMDDIDALQADLDAKKAVEAPSTDQAFLDYAQETFDGYVTDAQNAIDAYKAEIEAAYDPEGDFANVDTTKITTDPQDVQDEIDKVDWTTLYNDYEAYIEFWGGKTGKDEEGDLYLTPANLQKAYDDDFSRLTFDFNNINTPEYVQEPNVPYSAKETYKPKTNIWQEYLGKQTAALEAALKDNKGYAIEEGVITGAAAKLQDAQDEVQARIDAFQAIMDAANTLLTNQNAAWDTAVENYEEDLDQFNTDIAFMSEEGYSILSQDKKDTIEAAKKDYQDALDALWAYDAEHHIAHDLDVTAQDYTDLLDAVTTAKDAFDNAAGDVADIIKYSNKLEETWKDIQAFDAKYNGLEALMNSTYTDLKQAIANYQSDPTIGFGETKTGIDTFATTWATVKGAFEAAQTKIDECDDALDIYKEDIENAVIVGENDFTLAPFNAEVTGFEERISTTTQSYQGQLSAAAKAANPQECYDKATAVADQVNNENLISEIEAADLAFEQKLAESNYTYVGNIVTEIENAKTTYAGEPGLSRVTEPEIPEGVTAYGDLTAPVVGEKGTSKTDCTDLDAELVELYKVYSAAYDNLQIIKQNKAAFDALTTALTGAQDKIDTLENSIDTLTSYPASDYYKGEAGIGALQSTWDGIDETLNGYHEDKDENFGQVLKHQNALNVEISTLEDDVTDLRDAIVDNQTAYDSFIKKSDEVTNLANNIKKLLDEQTKIQGYDAKAKCYKVIEDVLTELAGTNGEISGYYAVGEVADHTDEYNEIFAEYIQRLNDAYDAENEGLGKMVSDFNTDWLADPRTGINTEGLMDSYKAAIETVNGYLYDLKNVKYAEVIKQVVDDNNTLYNLQVLYNRINELTSDISAFKSKFDAARVILSDTDMIDANENLKDAYDNTLPDLKAEAGDIMSKIELELNKVNDAALAEAEDYFDDNYSHAETKIQDIKDAFAAANITELPDAVGDLEDLLTDADEWNTENRPSADASDDAKEAYIDGLDAIMTDDLDVINGTDVNAWVNDVCNTEWNNAYTKDHAELLNLSRELAGYVDDPDLAQDTADFNACLTAVETLNNTWTKDNAAANLQQWLDDLKDQMDEAKRIVADAKQKHENNAANSAARDVLQPLALNLADDLDALRKYGHDRPGQETEYAGLQTRLDQLTYDIEHNTDLAGDGTYTFDRVNVNYDYIQKIEELRDDIEDAYEDVYEAEIAYAQDTLMPLVQAAFNNALTVLGAGEEMDEYDGKINAQADALKTLAGEFTFVDRDDKMAEVMDAEYAICDLIEELEAIFTVDGKQPINTLETTSKAVQEAYDAAKAALDALQSDVDTKGAEAGEYGEAVAAEYDAKLAPLAEALQAVNDKFEAEKDSANIIADADALKAASNAVAAEVETLKTAWETAQAGADKKFASDNVYDTLNAELAALAADVKAAYDKAESVEDLNTKLYNNLTAPGTGLIAVAQAALGAEKAAYTLTDESTFSNDVVAKGYKFVREALTAAARQAKNEAVAKADDALKSLTGNYVNLAELQAALNTAKTDAENIKLKLISYPWDEETGGWDYSYENNPEEANAAYDQIIADIAKINADIEATLTLAEESTYVPGDVNLNPDGVVNITDVQIIAGWIGNFTGNAKELYNEIAAENPRQAAAADIDHNDEININDLTAIIDLWLGKTASIQDRIAAKKAPKEVLSDDAFTLQYVGEVDGADRYAVVLNNPMALVAGVFDIEMANGARVIDVQSTSRTADHNVEVFDNGSKTRVLIYSMENAAFDGTAGAIAFIDVEGSVKEVSGASFADTYNRVYELNAGQTTVTDMIIDAASKAKDMIYDAAGRMYNKLQRGINIIRKADGTTTKEIRK